MFSLACGPWLWLLFKGVSVAGLRWALCGFCGCRFYCGGSYVKGRFSRSPRGQRSPPSPPRRPSSADRASNRIKTGGNPATLEHFHICFPCRDGERKTLCGLIFSKELPVRRHHFQTIVHYKKPRGLSCLIVFFLLQEISKLHCFSRSL